MGKSKKDRSNREVEEMRGMIRRLQKQLRQARKAEHILEEMIVEDEPLIVEEEQRNDHCPQCNNGKIKVFEAPHATYVICEECTYRHVIKG